MIKKIAGHSLFKNTIALTIIQLSNYIIPWLSLPFLGRVLGVNAFGKLSILLSITQLCNVVIDYGFGLSATYYISKNREDSRLVSAHISSVLIVKMMLFLSLLPFLLYYLSSIGETLWFCITFLLNILFFSLQPVFLFQGIERMKNITITSLASKLVYIIVVFAFVRNAQHIGIVFFGYLLGSFIAFVISIFLLFHEGYKLHFSSVADIKSTLKNSTEFFFSRAAVTIYTSLSTFIVGTFCGVQQAAYYSVAEKFYIAMQNLTSPISQAAYPYMVKTKNKKLYFKIFIFLGLCVSIVSACLFWFATDIVSLVFGSDFAGAALITRLFCVCIILNFAAISFGYPILSAFSKVHIANRSVVFGAVLHGLVLFILFYFDNITAVNVVMSIILTESVVSSIRIKAVFW